jgi:hypothetical protein
LFPRLLARGIKVVSFLKDFVSKKLFDSVL